MDENDAEKAAIEQTKAADRHLEHAEEALARATLTNRDAAVEIARATAHALLAQAYALRRSAWGDA